MLLWEVSLPSGSEGVNTGTGKETGRKQISWLDTNTSSGSIVSLVSNLKRIHESLLETISGSLRLLSSSTSPSKNWLWREEKKALHRIYTFFFKFISFLSAALTAYATFFCCLVTRVFSLRAIIQWMLAEYTTQKCKMIASELICNRNAGKQIQETLGTVPPYKVGTKLESFTSSKRWRRVGTVPIQYVC